MIGFQPSCNNECAVTVMERAGIAEDAYNHLKAVKMITLYQYSEDELASLRSDVENVQFIECDGIVSIYTESGEGEEAEGEIDGMVSIGMENLEGGDGEDEEGESTLISLSNCDNDPPNKTLMIGFQSSCDIKCAVAVMERAGIVEDAYTHLKAVEIITLYQYSIDELASLRSDVENVKYIECDGIVSINADGGEEDESSSSSCRSWVLSLVLTLTKFIL